ncbi:MAG TPA: hypothetical protein H9844_07080 [Candidatus Evtepia faecigallinarum]|nr:hypothetical protein [Candidatus Evtepia faecigallinarum]
MKKNWIGPVLMLLAAVVCVLVGQWYVTRVDDTGSPVSFREYRETTRAAYERLGLEPMDYQARYLEASRLIPFYCSPELLEEELAAIQRQAETGESPVSYEAFSMASAAVFARYGIEGGTYPPDGPFYCTPVMLENSLRYLETLLVMQQEGPAA